MRESNVNPAPRRRRAGLDDQDNTEKSSIFANREERKVVTDPFANVDMIINKPGSMAGAN